MTKFQELLTNLDTLGLGKMYAYFPQEKTLTVFDFDFQPNINKQEVLVFQGLAFMEKQENLVFIGSPGVGKTHLAISIGIEVYRQGKRTLFINCHELLIRLFHHYHQQHRLIWLGGNLSEPNRDHRHSGSAGSPCPRRQNHRQIILVERCWLTA